MEEKNIKVNDIITRLKNGELDSPNLLADYLVILSASLYSAGGFELDADIAYAKKWEEIKLSGEMTDKECENKGKQTGEYRTWKKMVIANKTLIEVIRSLKKKLANLNIEFQSGQNY
jgi:hypothetical protein